MFALHSAGAEHAVALRHQQTASDLQGQRWAQQTPSHAQLQQQPSSPDGATTVRPSAQAPHDVSQAEPPVLPSRGIKA